MAQRKKYYVPIESPKFIYGVSLLPTEPPAFCLLKDVHYLVGCQRRSAEVAITAVTRLLALMEICAVDRGVLEQAIALGLNDFEDAVQVASAMKLGLEAIVTQV